MAEVIRTGYPVRAEAAKIRERFGASLVSRYSPILRRMKES